MLLGVNCLYNPAQTPQSPPQSRLVDVIAVHDIAEDSSDAWRDPASGFEWLRDLLPQRLQVARILTYGYDGTATLFFADNAAKNLPRMAETMVHELQSDRYFATALARPMIFICHGLGGVLVKESLIFSSTCLTSKVKHLYDQYISTFAILFFGTPHGPTSKSIWSAYEKSSKDSRTPLNTLFSQPTTKSEGIQLPQIVDRNFTHLSDQYRMFFFWEQEKSSLGNRLVYIVDPESSAPSLYNTQTSGIAGTHSGMVKFSPVQPSAYLTVLAALKDYCQMAPELIAQRWVEADVTLRRRWASEISEMTGFSLPIDSGAAGAYTRSEPALPTRRVSDSRYFYPPQPTTTNFIGRSTVISKIEHAFFPPDDTDHNVRKCFVVFGMAGSGKTQLSSRYAYTYRDRYSAIFMIDATNKDTIRESFCKIGKCAELEPTENAGRHFLSQLEGPWLLIIDNADDPTMELRELYPQNDSVHLIITTRTRDFSQEATVGAEELQGLTKDEALKLLLTKANIPSPWDGVTETIGHRITEALGFLALGIIQAGTCIYKGLCNLSDYLTLHSSTRNKLRHRKVSTTSNDKYEVFNNVYATFDVSLDFLARVQSESRQDAFDLLRIMSFYHFDHIPVEIFYRGITRRPKSFQDETKASWSFRLLNGITKRLEPPRTLPSFLRDGNGLGERYRVNFAISELRSLSLVSFDGEFLSLHPLVHSWARDRLTSTERKLWAQIALSTIMESISLSGEGNDASSEKFYRDIQTHLDACLAENEENEENQENQENKEKKENKKKLIPESTLHTTNLGWKVSMLLQPTKLLIAREQIEIAAKCGLILAQTGQFERSSEYLQMTRDVLAAMLGHQHEKTMLAMLGLAAVYWGLGRADDAIILQEQVVSTRTRIHGVSNEETLRARNALGKSYWLNGQHTEALELQRVTADQAQTVFGDSHSLTLEALDNLGVTLGAWHDFEESLSLHTKVLDIRIKTVGSDHPDTLTTMSNRAMALLDLHRLEEANDIMTKVHQQREEQLGKEHAWTLWALCNLAKVRTDLGHLEETEKMMLWGIQAGIRSLGESHFGLCIGFGELARIYARQGRHDEAEKQINKTLELIELSKGPAHPDCVFVLWKLAQIYVLRNNPSEAIRTCQLGLKRAEMRISAKHPLSMKLRHMMDVLLDEDATAADLAQLVPRPTQVAPASNVSSNLRMLSKPRTATW